MRPEDKGAFLKMLGQVMAGYAKALDPATLDLWFNQLLPFDPPVIRRAFDACAAERPDFAPAPNGIAARCKLLDGRPGAEEAWAIALTTRGEEETVVWTEEARDAFFACGPVLAQGDEVGARMAFKQAYTRLVAAARADNRPVVWVVSEGWDKTRKAVVLAKAQREGLLPAPQATALLEGPAGDPTPDEHARAQLDAIRKMLADSAAEGQRKLERAEQERIGQEMALDIEIQAKVDAHLRGDA